MGELSNWRSCAVGIDASLREAIKIINDSGYKVALVIDEHDTLYGVLTDGDIRRALLGGEFLNGSIKKWINRYPVVTSSATNFDQILEKMYANKLQQIPIVEKGRVIGLHLWDELSRSFSNKSINHMLIMAGGFGKRLMPLTVTCPKPLLKIKNIPIIELIILNAKKSGINKILISLHYLGHLIKEHLGDGHRFGVEISYVDEPSPLGTGGVLRLIKNFTNHPFIVCNGDVLVDLDFSQLINYHNTHNAHATMAVKANEIQNPFGVVKMSGANIVGFEEKPTYIDFVNAGVYVLTPEIWNYLPTAEKFNMPDLFESLRINQRKIVAYPLHEKWADIGRHEDYRTANGD
jgi:dTDP-glucose pyrophosphorylase